MIWEWGTWVCRPRRRRAETRRGEPSNGPVTPDRASQTGFQAIVPRFTAVLLAEALDIIQSSGIDRLPLWFYGVVCRPFCEPCLVQSGIQRDPGGGSFWDHSRKSCQFIPGHGMPDEEHSM